MDQESKNLKQEPLYEKSVAVNKRASVSQSLHDRMRIEEPWSSRIEDLFGDMTEELKDKIKKHDQSGYYYRGLDARWGYPSVVLAGVMVPISTLLDSCDDDTTIKVLNAAAYATIALLAGTAQYFSYGKKSQKHFDISARYSDILTDIRMELVKHAQFRISADTFLQKIQMRIDGLNASAPIIPQHIAMKKYKKENQKVNQKVNQV